MFDLEALAAADRALAGFGAVISRVKLSEESQTTHWYREDNSDFSHREINPAFTETPERRCPFGGGRG